MDPSPKPRHHTQALSQRGEQVEQRRDPTNQGLSWLKNMPGLPHPTDPNSEPGAPAWSACGHGEVRCRVRLLTGPFKPGPPSHGRVTAEPFWFPT